MKDNVKLKKYIKSMIYETINEVKDKTLYENIKRIVKEEFDKENEVNDTIQGRKEFVMNALRNNDKDKYDHAYLSYKLWPSMDKDSARSYFSKCVRGERNFSDKDITSLFELIRSK